jgi:hypothetical protein
MDWKLQVGRILFIAAIGLLSACAKVGVPAFTSAEIHHSPRSIAIHTDPRLTEFKTMLDSLPGGWSQVENGPSMVGVMIVLKRQSQVVANLYVGKNRIGFKEADERGPKMGVPCFEKALPAGFADRVLSLFAP